MRNYLARLCSFGDEVAVADRGFVRTGSCADHVFAYAGCDADDGGFASAGHPPIVAPSGHWTLPYGALSIHRRGEWMVSMKGWSKYVWDFESSNSGENQLQTPHRQDGSLVVNQPSEPRKVEVTVRGKWRLDQPYDLAEIVVESEDQTVVAFICQDGKTVEVKLVSGTGASVKSLDFDGDGVIGSRIFCFLQANLVCRRVMRVLKHNTIWMAMAWWGSAIF